MNDYVSNSSKLYLSGELFYITLSFLFLTEIPIITVQGEITICWLKWLYPKTTVITMTNYSSVNCQFSLCLLSENTDW
jgi:hypothetical protein